MNKPPFDPSKAFQAVPEPGTKPAFDPSKPFEAKDISGAESFGRGALQGASLGFSDEATGALEGYADKATDWGRKLFDLTHGADTAHNTDIVKQYVQHRDEARAANQIAQEANPLTYGAGEVGGSVATMLVPGAGALNTLKGAAALGAVTGLGYSSADLTKGEFGQAAADTALGGALGTTAFGAGKLVGKGISAVNGMAKRGIAKAEEKATAQATKEVEEAIRSAKGAAGAQRQQGNRQIENLLRLKDSFTPEQAAVFKDLEAQGVIPALKDKLAQTTLDDLPGTAGRISSADEALASLVANKESQIAEGAQKNLSMDTAKAKLKERLLRYGPGGVLGGLAGSIGGPVGSAVGVGAGIGASRAVRSAIALAKQPSVQKAGWSLVRSLTEAAPQKLGKFAPALQRAATRGEQSLAATHFVLSQQDPEYRQHIASLDKESGETNDE